MDKVAREILPAPGEAPMPKYKTGQRRSKTICSRSGVRVAISEPQHNIELGFSESFFKGLGWGGAKDAFIV